MYLIQCFICYVLLYRAIYQRSVCGVLAVVVVVVKIAVAHVGKEKQTNDGRQKKTEGNIDCKGQILWDRCIK